MPKIFIFSTNVNPSSNISGDKLTLSPTVITHVFSKLQQSPLKIPNSDKICFTFDKEPNSVRVQAVESSAKTSSLLVSLLASFIKFTSVRGFEGGKIGLGTVWLIKIDLKSGSNSSLNRRICSFILKRDGDGASPCMVPDSILKERECLPLSSIIHEDRPVPIRVNIFTKFSPNPKNL